MGSTDYTTLFSEIALAFFVRLTTYVNYEELKKSMDKLTTSSVDGLLEKIRLLASRPIPELHRFEALKNAA